MQDKAQILKTVHDEFDQWENLLARLTEAELTSIHPAAGVSIKEVMAHLYAWQQVSIARLEAGLHDRAPVYPEWPPQFDVETESNVDAFNAWVFETYGSQSWERVHDQWRTGFLRFIELGETIPEAQLLDKARYEWLEGYSLGDILLFSCEHHQEHLDILRGSFEE